MVWIVIDENPWPDTYVPIYVEPSRQAMDNQDDKKLRVFDDEESALTYAKSLQVAYNAKAIRLFYSKGYSKVV